MELSCFLASKCVDRGSKYSLFSLGFVLCNKRSCCHLLSKSSTHTRCSHLTRITNRSDLCLELPGFPRSTSKDLHSTCPSPHGLLLILHHFVLMPRRAPFLRQLRIMFLEEVTWTSVWSTFLWLTSRHILGLPNEVTLLEPRSTFFYLCG